MYAKPRKCTNAHRSAYSACMIFAFTYDVRHCSTIKYARDTSLELPLALSIASLAHRAPPQDHHLASKVSHGGARGPPVHLFKLPQGKRNSCAISSILSLKTWWAFMWEMYIYIYIYLYPSLIILEITHFPQVCLDPMDFLHP